MEEVFIALTAAVNICVDLHGCLRLSVFHDMDEVRGDTVLNSAEYVRLGKRRDQYEVTEERSLPSSCAGCYSWSDEKVTVRSSAGMTMAGRANGPVHARQN